MCRRMCVHSFIGWLRRPCHIFFLVNYRCCFANARFHSTDWFTCRAIDKSRRSLDWRCIIVDFWSYGCGYHWHQPYADHIALDPRSTVLFCQVSRLEWPYQKVLLSVRYRYTIGDRSGCVIAMITRELTFAFRWSLSHWYDILNVYHRKMLFSNLFPWHLHHFNGQFSNACRFYYPMDMVSKINSELLTKKSKR